MNAWILFTRSVTLWNEPRLIARWLSKPNQPLHLVHPGRRGGREVQMKAGSRRQPTLDLGVLVRRVVVQDQVDEPDQVSDTAFLNKPSVVFPKRS